MQCATAASILNDNMEQIFFLQSRTRFARNQVSIGISTQHGGILVFMEGLEISIQHEALPPETLISPLALSSHSSKSLEYHY